ncbi:HD domain-containing protein [Granulosicoccus antarcticus]|uniref:HD domain-containing protein n=1 Tax=Granulosicoccus antarcticus IMCC3135 TaxID=1192854 RepID=A0A2Z2NIL6_9GAMM|nr:HD domain-containing protein [Granulosicoccus antarcticus]ASJ70325.1 hypothetical protein IMCC3135_01000 [Granulosicoccus antarcticus IMCC3135]
MIKCREDVYALYKSLGAPSRLIDHVIHVGAVAEKLANELKEIGVTLDENLVCLGAACHDAGKIIYKNELDEPGSLHELAGEKLLLEHDVSPVVARFCRSHAQYERMETSYEELLVALADKLWKGKRVENLELEIIDLTANQIGKERWDLFDKLDTIFEDIAAEGDSRLASTMVTT